MKGLAAYSNYRTAKADWLKELPSHWGESRLGAVFVERREKASDSEYQPLSVTMQGIVPQLETAAKSNAGDNRKLVRRGDFVINSRSDRKGSSGVSDRDGSVSLISIVLKPRGLKPEFAHHLLRSVPFQEEFYRYGKGIVADLWSTNFSEMKNIVLPIPSSDEQQAIAAFLDHETARIDRLIAKQERLIELLKEKRHAIISHAVTKGLNPDAPMKDSGIEWLGDVPAHWRVAKCGYYLNVKSGYAFPSSGFNESDKNTRLLRGINVGVGSLRWDEVVYWERRPDDDLGDWELHEGDLVIGMDRPLISAGVRVAKVGRSDVPCLLLQRVASIEPSADIHPDYLMHLLRLEDMFEAHFSPETTGVSVPHISPDQIKNFGIPIPPANEQVEVLNFLEKELSKIERLDELARAGIDLLDERRSSLISEVVTGRIDICGNSDAVYS